MTATTRTRSAAGAGEDRRALLAVVLSCAVLAIAAIALAAAFGERPPAEQRYLADRRTGREALLDPTASARRAPWLIAAYGAGLVVTERLTRRRLPRADPYLLPIAGLLAGLGVVAQARLAPDLAARYARLAPATAHLVGHAERLALDQLVHLAGAAAVLLGTVRFLRPAYLDALARRRWIYVVAGVALVLLTAAFGTDRGRGVKLWVDLGPVTVQPVELVKVCMVLFLAGFVAARERSLVARPFADAVPLAIALALALASLALQRDLGPAVLLYLTFVAVAVLGTGRALPLAAGIGALVAVSYLSYRHPLPGLGIVRRRVDMWLDPFALSEQGARALWSVASGGWLGRGLGRGLPEDVPQVESDLVFTVFAEETGLIGALALLALFALLGHRLALAARRAVDPWARYLFAGFMVLFLLSAWLIVAGTTAALPLTGITLPLVSQGGSALVVQGAVIGGLLVVSDREERRRLAMHAPRAPELCE